MGTVDEDGNLNFINPDGFSTFEITDEDPSPIRAGNTGYDSLQAAVDGVEDGGTIQVKDGYDGSADAVVNREVTFTLDNRSKIKSFNITAGDGYEAEETKGENTYSFKMIYKKADDKRPADWGKAHFTFSLDHKTAKASRTDKTNGANVQTVDAEVTSEVTEATCTEDGKTVYTAKATFPDGDVETTTLTVAGDKALRHDLEHVAAVEPAVGQEGNREYWHCKRCGRYWLDVNLTKETTSDDVRLAALEKPVEKAVEWGETKVTFASDHTYAIATRTDKNDATHTDTVRINQISGATDATCTEGGEMTYTAEGKFSDGTPIKAEETVKIAALGHTVTHVAAVKPTVGKEGNREYWHCNRCGKNWLDKDLTKEATSEDVRLAALEEPGNDSDDKTEGRSENTAGQTNVKAEKKPGKMESADTSDHMNMNAWGIAFILSAAAAAVFAVERKRRA